ncbi:MAG TPA: hypothetical protein VF203_12090 [Burkholderiales bacterium]
MHELQATVDTREPAEARSVSLAGCLADASRELPQLTFLGRALLITFESAAEEALPQLPGWAVYRIPSVEEEVRLPFAPAALDAVCVHGAAVQLVKQPTLLGQVYAMLRPGGAIVVIERPIAFSFAVFPIGGPAQLLRRQLLAAGFQRVRAVSTDGPVIALAGQRP